MNNPRRTEQEWADLLAVLKEAVSTGQVEPTIKAASEFLSVPYRTLQGALLRYRLTPEELRKLSPLSAYDPDYDPVQHVRSANRWDINSMHPEIHTIDELLDYCEVDRSVWMVDDGPILNAWPTTAKTQKIDLTYSTRVDENGQLKSTKEGSVYSDGQLVSKTNLQIKVRLRRIEPVAVVPVIRPITVGNGLSLPAGKKKSSGVRRVLFIADPHFGMSRNVHTGEMTPIHDRRVLDIALQIASSEPFDDITFLGDMLDLSEWSTHWVTSPEFYWTTQPALIEAHWWLRQFREAQPGAVMDALEGNHNRFKAAIIARLLAAYELRAVNELELDPAISLPKLLALHELNIGFVEGYDEGAAEKWFSDTILGTHGGLASSTPGATARKISDEYMLTVVFAHIHRREMVSKKVETRNGPITYTAVCPGTACRIDATVPGNKKRQQWQQGVAIMEYDPEDSAPPRFDLIEVAEGRAIHNGRVIEARDIDEKLDGFLRAELKKIT